MRRVPRRRREFVRQAAAPRHCGRWRLCEPRRRPPSALPAGLRPLGRGICRAAHVLGVDRLFGAQAPDHAARARSGIAGRTGRRRHDGACHREGPVSRSAARRRHRRGKAPGGARRRRGGRLRSRRSASAQGGDDGDRRWRICGLRFRRFGKILTVCHRLARTRRQGGRDRTSRRRILNRRRDVCAQSHDDRGHVDRNARRGTRTARSGSREKDRADSDSRPPACRGAGGARRFARGGASSAARC